ncbi:hypothetical protein XPA_000437 [Xanthoria parietina]
MFPRQFLILFTITTVVQLCVRGTPVPSEVTARSPPDARTINPLSLRVGSPPQPWNDHICRLPQPHHVYLTFSWGKEIPRAAVAAVIIYTKQRLMDIIRIHGAFKTTAVVERRAGLTINARAFEDHQFRMDQLLSAVDLLQFCGFDKGHSREMWAYIFDEHSQKIAGICLQEEDDQKSSSITRTFS